LLQQEAGTGITSKCFLICLSSLLLPLHSSLSSTVLVASPSFLFSVVIPSLFHRLTPYRHFDTRDGMGAIQAERAIRIAGAGQVPSNAVGISFSSAMVNHGQFGFFSIWPGGAWPGVSQGLFNPGTSGQTAGLVKVGGDGNVHLTASSPVDLAFDIDGYFASSKGLGFVPTEFPDRFYDSRNNAGHFAASESTVNVQIAGATGANGISVPWNAEVVVCTATVIR
jgi:hypothetical protein